MLQEELLRNGFKVDLKKAHHFIDAFVIFQKHTPRTLTAAYLHYCGKNLEDAHSANADTEATREVLLRQLEVHSDVPSTVTELEQYTNLQPCADLAGRLGYNDKGEITFNFGKYKGRTVREIFSSESSYYNWMMDGDFPLYTKQIITDIMQEIRATRKAEKAASKADESAKSHAIPTAPTKEQLDMLNKKFGKKTKSKPFDGQQSLF